MATVKTYAGHLRARYRVIARKLGVIVASGPKEDRVRDLAMFMLLGVLIKTLVDAGVITDAQLLAALDDARDDFYPDEPHDPPDDPDTPVP